MAVTAVQMGQGAIPAAGGTMYTVAAATSAVLKSFDIANTTSRMIRVRVFVVSSGGSAATTNAIMYDYPIVGNGVFGWEGEQYMATGASLRVQADVAGCTITASGVEVT